MVAINIRHKDDQLTAVKKINVELLSSSNEERLNRADMVICPINCVSHRAYWQVKKACKKQNKPCEFLNSSGVSSLENTLESFY